MGGMFSSPKAPAPPPPPPDPPDPNIAANAAAEKQRQQQGQGAASNILAGEVDPADPTKKKSLGAGGI